MDSLINRQRILLNSSSERFKEKTHHNGVEERKNKHDPVNNGNPNFPLQLYLMGLLNF